MRQLLPRVESPELDELALLDAYAAPDGPWLRATMISSLDGAAALGGTTRRLSSPTDQAVLTVVRQLSDVVLVGAGTARRERYAAEPADPAHADRRRSGGQTPAPGIAVVSGSLDLDPTSALFVGAETRTIVITCAAAPTDRRRAIESVAEVIGAGDDRVDAGLAVDLLRERGLAQIACEGGPAWLGQLVDAGRLDELCLTISPHLVGGAPLPLLGERHLARPSRVRLTHLYEEGGFLFGRYRLDSAGGR